jgi:hypothetical protein
MWQNKKEDGMKKTFSFLTSDSFRVDVKATSPMAAYKKLLDVPSIAAKLTKSYIQYDHSGYADLHCWKSLNNK